MKDSGRVTGVLVFVMLACMGVFGAGAVWAQGTGGERILYNGKIFTAEPENPYAAAVAIRGDKIVAVGNYPEVAAAVSANAERVDLQGKTLFPGFIDSHSHSMEGGMNLISADASDKVKTVDELVRFAKEAKTLAGGCGARSWIFWDCPWSCGRTPTN